MLIYVGQHKPARTFSMTKILGKKHEFLLLSVISLINHQCKPNVAFCRCLVNRDQIYLEALIDIAEGEEIFARYGDPKKYFDGGCLCQFCEDRTASQIVECEVALSEKKAKKTLTSNKNSLPFIHLIYNKILVTTKKAICAEAVMTATRRRPQSEATDSPQGRALLDLFNPPPPPMASTSSSSSSSSSSAAATAAAGYI